jgi:hypothetical protein
MKRNSDRTNLDPVSDSIVSGGIAVRPTCALAIVRGQLQQGRLKRHSVACQEAFLK